MPCVTNQSHPGLSPTAGRTAFVFSGGAVHGASQIGMVRRLFEAGIYPDVVVGSSAGAINGCTIAADPCMANVDHLEKVWRNLADNAPISVGRMDVVKSILRRQSSFDTGAGMRKLVSSNKVIENLEDAKAEIHVSTTNTETSGVTWWTSGPVDQVVLASAAIPGVLPSVLLSDGVHHIDGGLVANVPVGYAAALPNVSRLVVLDVTGSVSCSPTWGAVTQLMAGLRAASTELVRREWELVPAATEVIHISLQHMSEGFSLDFSEVPELISQGWHAADIRLASDYALVYPN